MRKQVIQGYLLSFLIYLFVFIFEILLTLGEKNIPSGVLNISAKGYLLTKNYLIGASLFCALFACHTEPKNEVTFSDKLFTLLPSSVTNIDFDNQLEYDEEFNTYTYRNFYNGGGVGLGDINNDGLTDLFFCGNMVDNKLYLNKGGFKFEDITEKAGVASPQVWSSGVSMADVNGDGWLDIYVCKSGSPEGKYRYNELFINNQDGTGQHPAFTERAAEYGIDDVGLSTHAAFFDYDKDGDLDMYLLNNSIRSIGGYDFQEGLREIRDPLGGNKLYRNEGNRFMDVSEEAGIYGSAIGFGLGVTIGDVNRDGWQDIYVSNDYFERDYLYINNKDGTFTESLEQQIREISLSSMGADMADINNDGYPEIFVTDMLPEDEVRMKTKTTFENWDKYQLNVNTGYYHQFTRNVLQLNNANGPDGYPTFSEIGRLADVEATDWSWGALIADLDNNGYKDIFVANGIYKDLTDQDYINFVADPGTVKAILTRENAVIKQLIDSIPSERIANYAFANNGTLHFENKAAEWGLDMPSHSNGSAYGDLDNDGDLDLVINNVNMPSFVYRNEADTLLKENNYLMVVLKGEGKNTFALGSQVTLKHQGQIFYQELAPMRGFQSSVDYRLHFGLGNIQQVDTVMVRWPDDRYTVLTEVSANQFLTLFQKDAEDVPGPVPDLEKPVSKKLFHNVTVDLGIEYEHKENDFVDFDRDRLLFHMLSREGPCLCKGDVNGDGREDFYVGGAKDQAGALFVQTPGGKFTPSNVSLWQKDQLSEDTDCVFFDADADGDEDLYVASGGNEFPTSSSALIDRLYLNDGRGKWTKSSQVLPTFRFESTGTVEASDVDEDGDEDLFVGIRLRPFLYGVAVNGYILENDGEGKFTDVTKEVAPQLLGVGMITDGVWVDVDGDKDEDLVVVGEWMRVKVFINAGGRLEDKSEQWGMDSTQGWWNRVVAHDVDADGDVDLVLGNHGWNSRFKASAEQPISMYVNDFDRNGTAEQVVSMYNGGESYPLVLRHDLVMQLPSLKKKYLKYERYKEQGVEDIFTAEQLRGAVKLEVRELGSSLLINEGDRFRLEALPVEAQVSPVYGVVVGDFDQDGKEDMVLGGNFYGAKPEVGRYDGSYGTLLKGDGQGVFKALPARQTGLYLEGEVREMLTLKVGKKNMLVVAKNNSPLQVIEIKNTDISIPLF